MPTQLHLSQAEMQELDKQRFRHKQAIVQRRLHCVYLKAHTELTNEQIGRCMDVHANQVGRYVRIYQQAGMGKLCDTGYGTNGSILEEHATTLVNAFTQCPALNLAEARHRIIELTGIERDISRVEAFLKKHGFVYRKCGYIPGKADPKAQQQWIEESFETELQAAQAGKKVLLFMDAAHFVRGTPCCRIFAACCGL